ETGAMIQQSDQTLKIRVRGEQVLPRALKPSGAQFVENFDLIATSSDCTVLRQCGKHEGDESFERWADLETFAQSLAANNLPLGKRDALPAEIADDQAGAERMQKVRQPRAVDRHHRDVVRRRAIETI